MLKDEYKVYEEKMKKSIESVMSDFDTVRAGRANASVLNRISVDYYGTPTPIQQIASIGSPDPRTLVITPWDASILKGIEKAIQESDLGINPQNDGKCIRLGFPQLTEERSFFYSKHGCAALTWCAAGLTSGTLPRRGRRCRPECRTPEIRLRPARQPAALRT